MKMKCKGELFTMADRSKNEEFRDDNPIDVSAEVKAIADAKNTPVEEPSTEPSTEPATEQPSAGNDVSPATGDVNVYMYLLLAAACAATFTGVTVYNKKSAR